MKKKVKSALVFLVAVIMCCCVSVNAEENEVYFVSDYGVQLTKKEYDLFVKMYNEESVKRLSQEKYKLLSSLNVNEHEIETVVYEDKFYDIAPQLVLPCSTFVETASKKLVLSKDCNSAGICYMVVTVSWKKSPATRSYDVIGARYEGYTVLNSEHLYTLLQYDTKDMYCANYKIRDEGHGCTFKVDDTANLMDITQAFSVVNTGTVYASYQHAQKNISKENSQKYYFSIAGLGNVFSFYDEAFNVYDAMNGVWLDV